MGMSGGSFPGAAQEPGRQQQEIRTAMPQAAVATNLAEGEASIVRTARTYDRIAPCPAFGQAVCFTGVIRVMPGSAN